MEALRVRRLKVLLLISSLACLTLLLLAAFEENFSSDWRASQIRFAELLKEPGHAAGHGAKAAIHFPIEIRQVFLNDLNRVDRCVSCHVGIENPAFEGAEQPLGAHPGNLLESHPVDRFGCTVCHHGQSRATDKDGAHGRVPFWDEPLLVGDLVQSTCAQCHTEDEVPQAPVLNHGRRLVSELGCAGCHQLDAMAPGIDSAARAAKAGPPLARTGSQVSRQWLESWLANPKGYLPKAKMPRFELKGEAIHALSAYLMTFRDPAIDRASEPEGDAEAGATIYREGQCIVCHVTKEDNDGNPVGGVSGPDLRKIGNKVEPRWLVAFLQNPHAFRPVTKMPGYKFNDQQAADLAAFMLEEWVDLDLKDQQAAEPARQPDSPAQIEKGKRLFNELGCAGCHDLGPGETKRIGPDLSHIGGKLPHELDFGNAAIRRTVADFLFTKLKSPRAFQREFQLPTWEKPPLAIWQNLRPAALFSDSVPLPDGPELQQLDWILASVQKAGFLDADLHVPDGSPRDQVAWLSGVLDAAGALSTVKMPRFNLSDDDLEALVIAMMSRGKATVPSKTYEVHQTPRATFDPSDRFGVLQAHYRCLSCHSIRGTGDRQASDLTLEGSRVRGEWLFHYLNTPYSMRRTLTIAMPIFHFRDEESRFMSDYMSMVFVDTRLDDDWERNRERADSDRGKALFDAKGCIACHQLHGKGGDVGPSLTTQVPAFPQGTWVGDKLKGGWIYQWLRNPQALVPDTLEPNLGLSDQEALDLTAFLLTLKSLDYQDKE
jgi:mono/diheme cytochrome c family protein